MKKSFCFVALLTTLALVGGFCGGKQDTASKGPIPVSFWYNNTGDEALAYEQAVAAYNQSQSKYKVEGLSVSDQQKLIVALASNESPDAVKSGDSNVGTFQGNGLITSLKSFIERDKYDMSIFSETSVKTNTFNGEIFGLPLSSYSIQLYYNKDLLAAAGYSEPPKTVEEMYEMAVKVTKLDANGNIDILGYPLFPLASARQELIYAFGGRWWAPDGLTPTPQDPGVIESLNYNVRYRKLYGIEKVQAFVTTANTNRYTEQDMFFAGKQLFRLDGSWLPTMMKNFNSTVNYGISLVPGTKANPNLRGISRFETSTIYIPINAKEKEGAWDFSKFFASSRGARIILLETGTLPAIKSLYTDPDVLAIPGFKEFIEALQLERGIQYARMRNFSEYISMINEHLDYVYSGQMTPEKAMAELADRAKSLK
jgi:multiple sugar transport system substrate-binding protein